MCPYKITTTTTHIQPPVVHTIVKRKWVKIHCIHRAPHHKSVYVRLIHTNQPHIHTRPHAYVTRVYKYSVQENFKYILKYIYFKIYKYLIEIIFRNIYIFHTLYFEKTIWEKFTLTPEEGVQNWSKFQKKGLRYIETNLYLYVLGWGSTPLWNEWKKTYFFYKYKK